jgi:hypothetical protein
MFCDHCGMQLQAGDLRCGRCGKTLFAQTELRRSRVKEHIRLLGILWMAYSALHVAIGGVLIIIGQLLFGHGFHFEGGPPPEIMEWLRPLVSFFGWLILAKAGAGFLAGWGLLRREDWARTLALVMGFIVLLSVPIGTALGIYTLWVLLPTKSDDEYKAMVQAQETQAA